MLVIFLFTLVLIVSPFLSLCFSLKSYAAGLCLTYKCFTFKFRRFLKGPNFLPWFQRKRAVAEQEQHRLWRHARMNADIQQFLSKMSELEIVDSFNAIERHIIGEIKVIHSC